MDYYDYPDCCEIRKQHVVLDKKLICMKWKNDETVINFCPFCGHRFQFIADLETFDFNTCVLYVKYRIKIFGSGRHIRHFLKNNGYDTGTISGISKIVKEFLNDDELSKEMDIEHH